MANHVRTPNPIPPPTGAPPARGAGHAARRAPGTEQGKEGRARVGPQTHPPRSGLGRTPAFLAGDIILFAGTGDLYSKVARWLMRGAHEGPTYTVHTAQFLDPWLVLEMDMLVRIETLDEMLNRRYRQGPGRLFPPLPFRGRLDALLNRQGRWQHRGFEVWRCRTLTTEQRQALTREGLRYVHVRLGLVKCAAHLVDNLLAKLLHRDVVLFRHLDPEDRHPVCSGITAAVYAKALHYRFGVDPECADPDQIHDWVRAHPDEWVCVFRRESDLEEQAHKVKVIQAAGRGHLSSPLKGATQMVANPPTVVSSPRLTAEQVWHALAKASFAVVSYVTPAGAPRSSGVVYKTVGQRLVLVTAPDSWKARQIQAGRPVAVTVPVRRGGLLSLMLPIPPATVSFYARTIMHPAGEVHIESLSKELAGLVPPKRRATGCVIELVPEGTFLTYGVGVSLKEMLDPAVALARVPVV